MKKSIVSTVFLVAFSLNALDTFAQLDGIVLTKECYESTKFTECPLDQLNKVSDKNPLLFFVEDTSDVYQLDLPKNLVAKLVTTAFRVNARVEGSLNTKTKVIRVSNLEEPPPPQRSFFKGCLSGGGGTGTIVPGTRSGPAIGFSTGGAKDIDNFRENLKSNYVPLPSSVTYEGLYYDYYFDLFSPQKCTELFCPSYSRAVSPDPFSTEKEYYLSVGLDSGITEFKRPPINLTIVLDYSGSMSSGFNQYYYDPNGKQKSTDDRRSKMELANEAIVNITKHLQPEDRFGLVLFDDSSFVDIPMESMKNFKRDALEKALLTTRPQGGTNMEAGMTLGVQQFSKVVDKSTNYQNRIIFITDAMPNMGATSEDGLLGIGKKAAEKGIYTTFVGVGVDFNTELIESITKMHGANYYFIQSKEDFEKRMDKEFDFMVTPLVFDLNLFMESKGFEIDTVYGSPESNLANGQLMQVKTLFPSAKTDEAVKGGIVLLKLKKQENASDEHIKLHVSYKDIQGKIHYSSKDVVFNKDSESYDSSGIRKAIVLTRYANLLKNWMIDQRMYCNTIPAMYDYSHFGIINPQQRLSKWERGSCSMVPSEGYSKIFTYFDQYLMKEMNNIGDSTLVQERDVMSTLIKKNK